jgi:hypothetical protein
MKSRSSIAANQPRSFFESQNHQGDREKDLDQLSGQWDAVIDTCGYFPRIVRKCLLKR